MKKVIQLNKYGSATMKNDNIKCLHIEHYRKTRKCKELAELAGTS